MAKKSARPNIPEATLERARRQMGTAPVAPVAPTNEAVAAPVPQPRTQLSSADLRSEYSYVVADLQSMAILAAGFLALLIVLSLVI